jgi:hypothetical protein
LTGKSPPRRGARKGGVGKIFATLPHSPHPIPKNLLSKILRLSMRKTLKDHKGYTRIAVVLIKEGYVS